MKIFYMSKFVKPAKIRFLALAFVIASMPLCSFHANNIMPPRVGDVPTNDASTKVVNTASQVANILSLTPPPCNAHYTLNRTDDITPNLNMINNDLVNQPVYNPYYAPNNTLPNNNFNLLSNVNNQIPNRFVNQPFNFNNLILNNNITNLNPFVNVNNQISNSLIAPPFNFNQMSNMVANQNLNFYNPLLNNNNITMTNQIQNPNSQTVNQPNRNVVDWADFLANNPPQKDNTSKDSEEKIIDILNVDPFIEGYDVMDDEPSNQSDYLNLDDDVFLYETYSWNSRLNSQVDKTNESTGLSHKRYIYTDDELKFVRLIHDKSLEELGIGIENNDEFVKAKVASFIAQKPQVRQKRYESLRVFGKYMDDNKDWLGHYSSIDDVFILECYLDNAGIYKFDDIADFLCKLCNNDSNYRDEKLIVDKTLTYTVSSKAMLCDFLIQRWDTFRRFMSRRTIDELQSKYPDFVRISSTPLDTPDILTTEVYEEGYTSDNENSRGETSISEIYNTTVPNNENQNTPINKVIPLNITNQNTLANNAELLISTNPNTPLYNAENSATTNQNTDFGQNALANNAEHLNSNIYLHNDTEVSTTENQNTTSDNVESSGTVNRNVTVIRLLDLNSLPKNNPSRNLSLAKHKPTTKRDSLKAKDESVNSILEVLRDNGIRTKLQISTLIDVACLENKARRVALSQLSRAQLAQTAYNRIMTDNLVSFDARVKSLVAKYKLPF